jgi:signal transduction histidine kinase/ActR/RegA family two-component response regulator
MRFSARRKQIEPAGRGLAGTAAAAGTGDNELVRETARRLLASGQADRVGVWIASGNASGAGHGDFRGMVLDLDGQATPAEWARLSPEAVLPSDSRGGGRCVEVDLDGAEGQLLFGALVDIRRAAWVPVGARERLCGVLFAGLRTRHGVLPLALLESVAADLGVILELASERRAGQQRQADLAELTRTLSEVADERSSDAMLTGMLHSLVDSGEAGLGAVFAVLRAADPESADRGCREVAGATPPAAEARSVERTVEVERTAEKDDPLSQRVWHSGDADWIHAIQSQPLCFIWERTRQSGGTITIATGGTGGSWPRGDVARIVAIPLRAAGQYAGTLVAGFPQQRVCQAALERLESRGKLAAALLVLRRNEEETKLHQGRQLALLHAGNAATLLVSDEGKLEGLSRAAERLLTQAQPGAIRPRVTATGPGMPQRFSELFRARDQRRVEDWRLRALSSPASETSAEPPEAELWTAGRTRLSCTTLGGGLSAISLEPVVATGAGASRERAEAQLVSVIEWLEEGVVLFDAQQEIRVMNTRFAQIAGLAPDDIRSIATLNELIARLSDQTAEPEKFARRWRELACGDGGGAREEIQLLHPQPRVLERASRPVLDEHGRSLGRVEIYRDLTAQRVFQSKLLQTEKLAALGQMVTSVAHELSNPLTSILGYAQRLFLRNDPHNPPDEIRQIFQEAERASAILRQLLMSAHESRPERRRVSLNHIIARTIELQKLNLVAERVVVELDLFPDLPFVLGDAGQLQQVLMNLIGNARQALGQRGRGGTIFLGTGLAQEGQVRLQVRDDGPGIPQAIASRIFDPFFTTKPAGIGTGLGLAIVLGVVREHGGQVTVSSPLAGGAMFTLSFPAQAPEARGTPDPLAFSTGPGRDLLPASTSLPLSQPSAPLQRLPGGRATARILVVEDEPTVARLIGDVLEDEGFRVDATRDGEEALTKAALVEYDLVICDMRMPGLDGQQFYKNLIGSGNPLWKRFLFVTGDVLAAGTREFLERHRVPHVAKPFRVEELTEKVRRVLGQLRPTQHNGEPADQVNVART